MERSPARAAGERTQDAALDGMFSESGSHFDPAVMEAVGRIRQNLIDAANAPVDHRV